jgi:hypothetical protein
MERTHSFLRILIGSVVVFCLFVVGDGLLRGQGGGAAAVAVAEPNSYVFQLELGGVIVAEYTQCSGLGSASDILQDTVAATTPDAMGTVIQKSPGALRWPEIKLRRKGLSNATVWSWRRDMERGNTGQAFRDGSITVVTAGPASVWVGRWAFHNGWAARLTFDSAGEELAIVHQGLESVGSSPATATRATRS